MSQPLNRTCQHDVLGELDSEAGEFWVGNPFELVSRGENLSAYERNRVFLNRQGAGFIDASFASQADIDSDSRSVIAGDFDGDLAPDLLIGSVGGGPLRLFLNEIQQGNRLHIDLVGTRSNRSGIGTRVTAEIEGMVVTHEIFPKNGCMGLGPVQLSIAAGDAQQINTLTLRWPSGSIQEFHDVPLGDAIVIREDATEIKSNQVP